MSMKGTMRSINAAVNREERRRRDLEKEKEKKEAAYEVQVYEYYIDSLLSIHKSSSKSWDWKKISKINPPDLPQKETYYETIAEKQLDSYNSGIFDKLLNRTKSKKNKLIAQVKEGRLKDENIHQKDLDTYDKDYKEWHEINILSKKIITGDVSGFVEAIELINPFSEISELGSSIQFSIESNKLIEVALDVSSNEVIPKESKTLLKTGKVSIKPLSKTRFFELYQDYICSAILRMAREVFAILPIDTTIITAYGEILNTSTGHIERQPILSVLIPRKTLYNFNFDNLDPSDSMNNFLHNVNFNKTKGFKPVEKLTIVLDDV